MSGENSKAEDIVAIEAIPHAFARALDRRDADAIRACFHPDGIDDHGMFKGTVDEFVPWVLNELARYERTQHMISTQTIKINGTKAGCESYFYSHHVLAGPEGPLQMRVSGRYLDTMEKRDGVWRIMLRNFVVDWTDVSPLQEVPSEDGVTIWQGRADAEDPSYAFFAKFE